MDEVVNDESGDVIATNAMGLEVGTTGGLGEVVVGVGQGLWLGVLDSGSHRGVDGPTLARCDVCVRQELEATSPSDDIEVVSGRVRAAVARVLRRGDASASGTVTVQVAHVVDHRIRLAWTSEGSAYLVRGGEVIGVAEGTRAVEGPAAVRLPFPSSGGRDGVSATSRSGLHTVPFAWVMRPGDRVVLAPMALSRRFQRSELVSLLASGSAEGAAHTLQQILRLRGFGDVALAILDVGMERPGELQSPGGELQELLAGLAGLLPATDPVEQPLALVGDEDFLRSGEALLEGDTLAGDPGLEVTPMVDGGESKAQAKLPRADREGESRPQAAVSLEHRGGVVLGDASTASPHRAAQLGMVFGVSVLVSSVVTAAALWWFTVGGAA